MAAELVTSGMKNRLVARGYRRHCTCLWHGIAMMGRETKQSRAKTSHVSGHLGSTIEKGPRGLALGRGCEWDGGLGICVRCVGDAPGAASLQISAMLSDAIQLRSQ
jgi:hypothetical protein